MKNILSICLIMLFSIECTYGQSVVKDFGTKNSYAGMVPVGGKLLFMLRPVGDESTNPNPNSGFPYYITDGTSSGTEPLSYVDGEPLTGGSTCTSFLVNGYCYFAGYDKVHSYELWKTNGTAVGTGLVKEINSCSCGVSDGCAPFATGMAISAFGTAGGKLFFNTAGKSGSFTYQDYCTCQSSTGNELWVSDGESTHLLADIIPGLKQSCLPSSSDPYPFKEAGGKLFFSANTLDPIIPYPPTYPLPDVKREVFVSDGSAAGTRRLTTKHYNVHLGTSSVSFNNLLFFLHYESNSRSRQQLWKSDGTDAGTSLVKELSSDAIEYDEMSMAKLNSCIVFARHNYTYSNYLGEIWKSDGTPGGTTLLVSGLKNIRFYDNCSTGTIVYFTANNGFGIELWSTDGTVDGTKMIKDINPGSASSISIYNDQSLGLDSGGYYGYIGQLVDGIFYFGADDGVHGIELWQSDGTSEGTFMIKDIQSGSASSSPKLFRYANKKLFFVSDGKLWKYDIVPQVTIQHFNQLATNSAFRDQKLLSDSKTKPFQVCADGSTASVFKLSGGSYDYTKMRVKTSGDDTLYYGRFIVEKSTTDSLILRYRHPAQLAPLDAFRQFSLHQYSIDNPDVILATRDILVNRAPVLMIHGLWSDRSAFVAMENDLLQSGLYIPSLLLKADYSGTNNVHFSDNAEVVPNHIVTLLSTLRLNGISAGKVDVVGHSMGGILTRLYLQSQNYSDDLRRLITLNTPHAGSQVANFLLDETNESVNSIMCKYVLNIVAHYGFNPNNTLCNQGAVSDLRVDSDAISRLNSSYPNIRAIPSHAVITTGNYQGIADKAGLIVKVTKTALFPFTLDQSPNSLFKGDNDWIVSVPSQSGGLSGSQISQITEQIHIGSPANSSVINEVKRLLGLSPSNPAFSQLGFNPPVLRYQNKVVYPQYENARVAASSLSITAPYRGKLVPKNSPLTLSVRSTAISQIKIIIEYNADSSLIALQNQPNASYTFSVGSELGRRTIVVFGKGADGTISADTTHFTVVNEPYTDVRISLQSNKRVVAINEPINYTLRLGNDLDQHIPVRVSWQYRLPPNVVFLDGLNSNVTGNIVEGNEWIYSSSSPTVTSFRIKLTAPGIYLNAVEITSSSTPDIDSQPNSGTGDGEDDAAIADVRTFSNNNIVYSSPNPNQIPLADVIENYVPGDPTKADLSLQMQASKLAVSVNDVISITLVVSNAGGLPASNILVENLLPAGLVYYTGAGWVTNGNNLSYTIGSLQVNQKIPIVFQARVTAPGRLINKAQISASSLLDPDSTVDNGFLNGEDDQSSVEVRAY